MQLERIETEVVIVGSGAAGLRAAVEIRDAKKNCLVMSKGPIGLGTSTAMSGGAFSAPIHGLSPEKHLERTLSSGRGLNCDELIEVLTGEGPERLSELVDWGIESEEVKGYLFVVGKPPTWGRGIVDVLAAKGRSMGVQMRGDLMALEVLAGDGRLEGLLAYDWKKDKCVLLSCGAIILATGGASALYLQHDNPQRMMGDGYALAFRAGARMMDMEFVQFYPLGIIEKGKAPFLLPPLLAEWGRLVNELGEDIQEKYGIDERPAGIRARDRLSQAIWMETNERAGGEVYCDISSIPDSKWSRDRLALSTKDLLIKRYRALEKPLPISTMAHHTMGGVVIDRFGATSVQGLFAAGEVTAGVHGANRMGGNALTDALVFGARAGRAAAGFIEGKGVQRQSEDTVQSSIEALSHYRERSSGLSPKPLREKLRNLMWEKVGVIREREGLEEAMEHLKEMESGFNSEGKAGNPREFMEAVELRGALHAARMVTMAAHLRNESRGSHSRKDFPEQDDLSWKGHIIQQKTDEGEIDLSFLKV